MMIEDEDERDYDCAKQMGYWVDHYFFCALDDVDDTRLSTLSKTVADDLELPIMYDELFAGDEDNLFFEHIRSKWLARITTDVAYLEDTQEVVRGMEHFVVVDSTSASTSASTSTSTSTSTSVCSSEIRDVWQDTIGNAQFFEDNNYVKMKKLHFINKCIPYLQTQSTCTILAPVFNLFYMASNAFLLFFSFSFSFASARTTLAETPFSTLLYYVATALLFLYHIYQNIYGSFEFRNIIEKANAQLLSLRRFHDSTIEKMRRFEERFGSLGCYRAYCARIGAYRLRLADFSDTCLRQIAPLQWTVQSYQNFGYILKAYYTVANSRAYQECLAVAIGFDAYIKAMVALHRGIGQAKIAFATFGREQAEAEAEEEAEEEVENTHIAFLGQSYPVHFNLLDNVTNDVRIKNDNVIITGINASGKTTVIKTLTINLIFSQQIGCGYYRSGHLLPYRHIHSYLNIPDTANRDSLFQAESRRCKTILDSIGASLDDRHFCIFDELYSGTNPDDATKAACSYIAYLAKHRYVTFLLTTHYHQICHYVENHMPKDRENAIKNYHMNVLYRKTEGNADENAEENPVYLNTYKLVEGISTEKNGAYRVLAEMQYPKELLQSIRDFK